MFKVANCDLEEICGNKSGKYKTSQITTCEFKIVSLSYLLPLIFPLSLRNREKDEK